MSTGPGRRHVEHSRSAAPGFRTEERDGIMVRVFTLPDGSEVVDESSFRPLPAGHKVVFEQPDRMCEPAVTDYTEGNRARGRDGTQDLCAIVGKNNTYQLLKGLRDVDHEEFRHHHARRPTSHARSLVSRDAE